MAKTKVAKKEKPIRVIPYGGKHRTESRVFAREIYESFCAQPGCKFKGKPTVQGHCHTREPFVAGMRWSYIEKLERASEDALREEKSIERSKADYIRALESNFVCMWMNSILQLDGMVRLRAENALLKLRLARRKR